MYNYSYVNCFSRNTMNNNYVTRMQMISHHSSVLHCNSMILYGYPMKTHIIMNDTARFNGIIILALVKAL